MKNKYYSVKNLPVEPLLHELENFFRMQGHQVQVLPIGNAHVLQALKENTLSSLTGQTSALTIKIEPDSQGTRVEVGSSKWIDKAAVGMIGYVIMPVLAIIPMIGIYNQYRLGEESWRIIDSYIARYFSQTDASTTYQHNYQSSNPPPSSSQRCPNCSAWLAQNAAFCSGCGAQIKSNSAPVCKKCNTTNQLGSRFCSGCGSRFEN